MKRICTSVVILVLCCSAACAVPIYIYGDDFDLRIPAEPNTTKGWMLEAQIDVPEHITVKDVDVLIDITHTKVFDLQLFLESPRGTQICLNMYNPFAEYFEGENYTGTIFDDEAALAIEKGQAPFTGRFRPRDFRLSAFDNEDGYGRWRLRVYDAFYADMGWLNRFQLMITVPEQATVFLLAAGIICVRLFRRQRMGDSIEQR